MNMLLDGKLSMDLTDFSYVEDLLSAISFYK